jgi:hypothetical protein
VTREERRVQVQTCEPRDLQHAAWKDLTVGNHHDNVWAERTDLLHGIGLTPDALWLKDRNLRRRNRRFDRPGLNPLTASDGPVRLRHDADQIVGRLG